MNFCLKLYCTELQYTGAESGEDGQRPDAVRHALEQELLQRRHLATVALAAERGEQDQGEVEAAREDVHHQHVDQEPTK